MLGGGLDVGVIASPVVTHLLQSEVLFIEELLLSLPPNHSCLKSPAISGDHLAGENFVLMNELHCLGEQVVGLCKRQGLMPAITCQSVQLLTIHELVALGHGLSLIPTMAREMDRGRLCAYRSLGPTTPTRTIRMVWHKDRYHSSLVKEFIKTLRDGDKPGTSSDDSKFIR
jgi:LysR family hydrogen peroxide-inducible transcriptional activator